MIKKSALSSLTVALVTFHIVSGLAKPAFGKEANSNRYRASEAQSEFATLIHWERMGEVSNFVSENAQAIMRSFESDLHIRPEHQFQLQGRNRALHMRQADRDRIDEKGGAIEEFRQTSSTASVELALRAAREAHLGSRAPKKYALISIHAHGFGGTPAPKGGYFPGIFRKDERVGVPHERFVELVDEILPADVHRIYILDSSYSGSFKWAIIRSYQDEPLVLDIQASESMRNWNERWRQVDVFASADENNESYEIGGVIPVMRSVVEALLDLFSIEEHENPVREILLSRAFIQSFLEFNTYSDLKNHHTHWRSYSEETGTISDIPDSLLQHVILNEEGQYGDNFTRRFALSVEEKKRSLSESR